MTEKSVLAWYFAPANKRLNHGDGRLIRVGETHGVTGRPMLCEHGLHGSIRPLDALQYASSSTVFRVRLSGPLVKGDDKCAALKRTYIAELEAELVLGEFARKCASAVLHLWNAPNIVKQWLHTGDPGLRNAAWSAAWNAAESAAESAARSAASSAALSVAWRSAAESVARNAAKSAARSAAESAARSAASSAALSVAWRSVAWRSAAESVARNAAKSAARSAAESAASSAASSAAWSAAWDAAWGAQNKKLQTMLLKAIKQQVKP